MAKRKPTFGEFWVFHDNPIDVIQVDAVMDGMVRFHSRVTHENHERSMATFMEFYTRIPI